MAAAIEYNVAEYCKLRCAHCDQASWMLPVKFADPKSFRRDMTALAAETRFLADGLGVVTAGAHELIPQDAPALVVGAWPDDSPGPPDTTVSQDHSRPGFLRNEDLLGLTTLLDERAVAAVVNVDLWRPLMPDDVNRPVAEALRIAPEPIPVHTDGDGGSGPAYSCATLDSAAAMLAHHVPVTTSRVDGAEVLRVAGAVVHDA
ncbi:hypothetical protein [Micromonospora chersina]|uniref:hypothetical protein n=1 Tax=Micromonospora chersina TaxID=47854 RepID=UPI0033D10FDF